MEERSGSRISNGIKTTARDWDGAYSSYSQTANMKNTVSGSSAVELESSIPVTNSNAWSYGSGMQDGSLTDLEFCGTNRLDPSEDDAAANVEGLSELEENKGMLPRTGLVPMTDAERELENWRSTHIICPNVVLGILHSVCDKLVPRIGFGSGDEESIIVEYLSRSYQELLNMLLSKLVNLAHLRHRCSNGSKVQALDGVEENDPQSDPQLIIEDLDTFSDMSRTLPHKIKVLIRECKE